jgi:hypothetical protein
VQHGPPAQRDADGLYIDKQRLIQVHAFLLAGCRMLYHSAPEWYEQVWRYLALALVYHDGSTGPHYQPGGTLKWLYLSILRRAPLPSLFCFDGYLYICSSSRLGF